MWSLLGKVGIEIEIGTKEEAEVLVEEAREEVGAGFWPVLGSIHIRVSRGVGKIGKSTLFMPPPPTDMRLTSCIHCLQVHA